MATSLGIALAQRHKASVLSYCEIDAFSLLPTTTSLEWNPEGGQSETVADANAQVLAGVLRTNTTLTSLSISPDAKMSDQAQSVIGRALLYNSESNIAFLSGFNEFFDVRPGQVRAGGRGGEREATLLVEY